MGRKVGLDLDQITAVAVDLVESDGLEAATLSSVADRLGVRVPSLYNHVSGLAGLRRLISLAAVDRLTEVCRIAGAPTGGDGPGDPLRRVAKAYRRFAVDHPGLYRSLLPAPTAAEDPELHDAMAGPVLIVAETIGGAGDPTADETVHAIRALRSLVHGFVDLENNGGFGLAVDVDETFDRAIELVISPLTSTDGLRPRRRRSRG